RHYVVVSPAVLYHPHTGMVSVHLSDLNETVRVSVRLERGDGPSAITLLEREVRECRLHENVPFQVPAPSGGQQEVAELHVSIRGDALQFSERKKVLLRALQPRTFVQTDKAVYKPGQTVKFRIVSLDVNFVPSTRKQGVSVCQDPSGNRIAQWRDVTPQQGIVDLSLPLSAEPALGTYTIEVQGTRHSFSVEEYGAQWGPGPQPRLRLWHVVVGEFLGAQSPGTAQLRGCPIAAVGLPHSNRWGFPCHSYGSRARGHGGELSQQHRSLACPGCIPVLCWVLCTPASPIALSISQGHFKQVDHSAEHDRVYPSYPDADLHLTPFYSKSQSFLKIRSLGGGLPCDQAQQVQVDYVIAREALGNGSRSLDFIFLVSTSWVRGSFSVELPVGADLAPAAKVLGYTVLPDGELAADSARLHVAKCLPNKVKLAFSQDWAVPGSELQLRVQAAPGSLCAVRAVDQSVLLMKPEAELSVSTVSPDSGHIWAGVSATSCPRNVPKYRDFTDANTHRSSPGFAPNTVWSSLNPFASFLDMTPKNMEAGVDIAAGTPVSDGRLVPEPSTQEEPAPHAYFPEMWLWDLVPVGEGGSKDIPVSVPDTITEWKVGMFCTAEVGFGLSPTATFTAFKPFFVELALPYSVIRGEAFALKATVFNYLRQCIKVQVTLAESAQFQVQAGEDGAYTSCLCADEGKTFQWEVTASSLGEVNFTVSTEALRTEELCGTEVAMVPAQGRVHTVIKPLLVQVSVWLGPLGRAEGDPGPGSQPLGAMDQVSSEEISLQLPANVLAGSERAHVTVLGDIMGTALQNIERLLAMPDGNGEQNMVQFTPNIYIQQYLEKSGQLSPEIRDKAQGFLQSGYQRELLYKHNDGSYSAFGESDATGNTWLTAFVLKSFGQARSYISIDEKHLEDALGWLQRRQRKTGCFRSVGKLLNHTLQVGGWGDGLMGSGRRGQAGEGTLADTTGGSCLGPRWTWQVPAGGRTQTHTSDLYTQALLAYAFGLAGSSELRDALLQSLAQHSLHWQRKVKALPSPYGNQAPSAEVEMTAYVLLAYLSLPNVSAADMTTAAQIVRWLSKQQNLYGDFASTQDMVLALQAQAKYAALTYSTSGAVSVTVSSQAGARQQFHVENANRLVLQRAALQEIPGQYTVRASGKGCVFVQLTLRYNVPPPKSATTFDLRVKTEPKECTESARSHFSLVLYSGERPASNMAIIEAKLPSGYTPVKRSLRQLTKEAASFTFSLEQDFPVKNLRAAPVRLYDYYETGESHPGPAPITATLGSVSQSVAGWACPALALPPLQLFLWALCHTQGVGSLKSPEVPNAPFP
uniref:A2ML1 protein n=1 Tax=Chrysemys picta bellii TaxID=8478 RepID=A0A8C3G028_CHRPI